MATSSATRRAVAKAAKGGKSPIAGFAAKARKVVATRNGPKATETHHLQPDQFPGDHSSSYSGRHRAAPSSYSVGKNVSVPLNSPAVGRHSSEPYMGRHRGNYDHFRDVEGVIKNGGYAYGKHASSL